MEKSVQVPLSDAFLRLLSPHSVTASANLDKLPYLYKLDQSTHVFSLASGVSSKA